MLDPIRCSPIYPPKIKPKINFNLELFRWFYLIWLVSRDVDSPFKYMKNRMDEIDFDKYYVKYTTIEGDILGDTLECIVFENKFEQSEAGCRFTVIGHHHTMGDIKVNEDDIARTKEGIKEKVKAVEDYLLANPQVHA